MLGFCSLRWLGSFGGLLRRVVSCRGGESRGVSRGGGGPNLVRRLFVSGEGEGGELAREREGISGCEGFWGNVPNLARIC